MSRMVPTTSVSVTMAMSLMKQHVLMWTSVPKSLVGMENALTLKVLTSK